MNNNINDIEVNNPEILTPMETVEELRKKLAVAEAKEAKALEKAKKEYDRETIVTGKQIGRAHV